MSFTEQPKLVIIGDGAIGKTCLMQRFHAKGFTEEGYVATGPEDMNEPLDIIFTDGDISGPSAPFMNEKNEPTGIEADKRTIQLWDTAGQEAMESLRELAYPKSHVILLGYNTSNSLTLEHAQSTWQEELVDRADNCPITKNAPRILVGTMCDRRDEMVQDGKPEWTGKVGEATSESYVTAQQAYEVAKQLGCVAFVETSSKTSHGCQRCLQLAITAAFTYLSTVDNKQDSVAMPLKIEQFDPSKPDLAPAAAEGQAVEQSDVTMGSQSSTTPSEDNRSKRCCWC